MVPPSASLHWMLPARSGGTGSGGISMGSCTGSHPACPRPPASLVHLSVHFQDHPRCRSGARRGQKSPQTCMIPWHPRLRAQPPQEGTVPWDQRGGPVSPMADATRSRALLGML